MGRDFAAPLGPAITNHGSLMNSGTPFVTDAVDELWRADSRLDGTYASAAREALDEAPAEGFAATVDGP